MKNTSENTAATNNNKNTPTFMLEPMNAEVMNEVRRVLTALKCDEKKTVLTDEYIRTVAIVLVKALVPADLIADPKIRASFVNRAVIAWEILPKNASAMRQAVYEAKKESAATPDSGLAEIC